VILFWLRHEDNEKIDASKAKELKAALKEIYTKHGSESKVVVGGEADSAKLKKLRSMSRISKEVPSAADPADPVMPENLEAMRAGTSQQALDIVETARVQRELRDSKERDGQLPVSATARCVLLASATPSAIEAVVDNLTELDAYETTAIA